MTDRPILWTPTPERYAGSTLARFEAWLAKHRDLYFDDYNAMWAWSVSDLEGFWSAIWDFSALIGARPSQFLVDPKMPGTKWAPDARLNYAAQVLRHRDSRADDLALIVQSETFGRKEITWSTLASEVASVAHHFRRLGLGPGDRVVAILPNTETALVAFLASAAIGAIWSLCAPDMGEAAILDRFQQIEPKILIAQDGYIHAGKRIDRRPALRHIAQGLPSLDHIVTLSVFAGPPADHIPWQSLTGTPATLDLALMPFDHPLWIVYSSGTTGAPKAIVHGHGGISLGMAALALHSNAQAGDRTCWLTSSGWVMWNAQWANLAQGATACLFDGAVNHPDLGVLWRFVATERITAFGAGAAFFDTCRKHDLKPKDLDLSALQHIGATGSPLSSDGYRWVYDSVKSDVWLAPISGGTDFAGAFVVGHPGLAVRAGEMQCRALGTAVRAFDGQGNEVLGEVGELVCTAPLPSMPLYFWGDPDGTRLYESYFDTYPGIWRHGDWIEITPEGGSVIYGRSDTTINRKGLRLGSSEIYRAVEALPEVMDSLVVDLEYLGRDSFMPLFVVLAEGHRLDDALCHKINQAIRDAVSPRFQPNVIHAVPEIPRTLSGKKLELPVKKLLLGGDPHKVVNRDAMANPGSFDTFIAYAKETT